MKNEQENFVKFGGPTTALQVKETMLNFKCKGHRVSCPKNRTDQL